MDRTKIIRSAIKKSICALTAAALFLSALVFCAPAAYAGTDKNGTVNSANANLRERPSTASNVIVKLEAGAGVSVLGEETDGWYKVGYENQTGYVRACFIDVMVTGLNDPAVIMMDSPLFKDHDAAGEIAATLPANTQVTVTGSFGSLYQIKTGSRSGYVLKSSVHKYRIISIEQKATVKASGVNLRKEPNTDSEILGTMTKGASVVAHSIQDQWIKVTYSGKTGYIKGNFISYKVSPNITTMATGMRGQAVAAVQLALKRKGFFYPAANGVYGNATRTAVKKFQEMMGLPADGIAGPQTLLLLLGSDGAARLWYNYRDSMPAQKPQKNGKVWLVDWFGGMDKLLKRFDQFEVIDVRTGIHWEMERFGGVTALWHADVCPMTKSDTAAMKKAWGGEFNSSRRPVWIKYGGKYYAASLMGFVHNTSPIKDNGMDGQVCLHFRGSRIHAKPGHIDEAHQACIWEAFSKASKLDDYIAAGKV